LEKIVCEPRVSLLTKGLLEGSPILIIHLRISLEHAVSRCDCHYELHCNLLHRFSGAQRSCIINRVWDSIRWNGAGDKLAWTVRNAPSVTLSSCVNKPLYNFYIALTVIKTPKGKEIMCVSLQCLGSIMVPFRTSVSNRSED
jgi:hypothetical protein